MQPSIKQLLEPVQRIRVWYVLLLLVFGLLVVRLFYIQIIQHDHYKTAAQHGQLREYEIPAERGVIEAYSNGERVPIVLNETKYTLFADPAFIEDHDQAAIEIQEIIGGDANEYKQKMTADSRYVILAKKLDKDTKKTIESLDLKGIGLRDAVYRTYPQGKLASQSLGFVNDEGEGVYGVEQALNEELSGTPGMLRAITDAQGVPLPANRENTLIEPQNGQRVVTSLDIGMQKHVEDILRANLKRAKSSSGGVVVLEADTGAIKAMANYPTYDPAKFSKVSSDDIGVFENNIVSGALEVGSIMKPLTVAAALNEGVIQRDSTYYDSGFIEVDGATITNVEESGGAGTRSIKDILQLSLNTGATWMLKQLGGGEINKQARTTWHNYMTDHYYFGQYTGIEQGYESAGSIPDPVDGFGLNIQFANTAFGQGMTATPLQMGAALASVVNGGTRYHPYLVESVISQDGGVHDRRPQAVNKEVVSRQTSKNVKELMEYVFQTNHRTYGMDSLRPKYSIGGKTGTAQVPKPEGGYYEDKFNGMFMGFVGGDNPEYIIVARVNDPQIGGYAGSTGAGPVFTDIVNVLIDNFGVTPKK
ncbi:MAG: penicillin-binding protein 2 [Candidatus Saccharibacteria bacterium]|nr:penicillin-binding protein 2 [Candidatus Saccharibacteria bacterium]